VGATEARIQVADSYSGEGLLSAIEGVQSPHMSVRHVRADRLLPQRRAVATDAASLEQGLLEGVFQKWWILGVYHARMSFETNAMVRRHLTHIPADATASSQAAGSGTAANSGSAEGSDEPPSATGSALRSSTTYRWNDGRSIASV
jgi:hypothetical protein